MNISSAILFLSSLLVMHPLAQASDAVAIGLDSPLWELDWSDEFNGPGIDPSKWTHVDRGDGFGNQELQYYSPRPMNSFIENGKLVVKAIAETYQNCDYSSAKLESKKAWTYGRFSFCAKMPVGKGLWPAIWMLPEKSVYGGWPLSGEIDIMEYLGNNRDCVFGTLHYGNVWPHNVHTGQEFRLKDSAFSDGFHRFDLVWIPGQVQWFVDEKLYETQEKWFSGAENATWPAPFDQNFFIILGLAVGGRLPGNPDATTMFPQRLEIDYARVYRYTGEYPKILSPMAKAIAKLAPGFELDGSQTVSPERGPVEYINDRIAFRTHPRGQKTPAVLSRIVAIPTGKRTVLTVGAGQDPQCEWELRVQVNDVPIYHQMVSDATTTSHWCDTAVDLSAYAGKTISLVVENRAARTERAQAYWSNLKVHSE